MNLGDDILNILKKSYPPNSVVETNYQELDLAFKTDDAGIPILLFLGKKDDQGQIRGERYARLIKKTHDGTVVTDHWDHEGRAT